MKLDAEYLKQLRPTTRFGKFSVVVVIAYLVLSVVSKAWTPSALLSAPIKLLFFLVVIRYLFKWLRIVTRHLLWRLRRRLIVTYLLVGVVPVVLLFSIMVILGIAFLGQLGSHFITSDLERLTNKLDVASRSLAGPILDNLSSGTVNVDSLNREFSPLLENLGNGFSQVSIDVVTPAGHVAFDMQDGRLRQEPPRLSVPTWIKSDTAGLFEDEAKLYYMSLVRRPTRGGLGTVILRTPFDSALLRQLSERNQMPISVMKLIPVSASTPPKAVRISFGNRSYVQGEIRQVDPGATARFTRKEAWYDFSIPRFPFMLSRIRDWNTGEVLSDVPAIYLVNSTWLRLARRLFSKGLGGEENVIAVVLAFVCAFFFVIEVVALITSLMMTRTITGAVHNLDQGAQHILRGDFSHRIPVKVRDQLSSLGETFNTMTASIERLLKEQAEKQKLESELAIALEVQKQLFPSEAPKLGHLRIAGVCNPARIVSGDYYDFLMIAPTTVGLALGDVSGKGVSAALLMASLQAALRSHSIPTEVRKAAAADGDGAHLRTARGAASTVAEVVSLLNEQLYQNSPSEKYVTFFYSVYDDERRWLTYTNAGHLPPLIFNSQGFRRLETGGTVLGLLREVEYEQGGFSFSPNDVMVAYTDGITEAENSFGEQFGERRLIEVVRGGLHHTPDEILQTILDAVMDWVEEGEPQDDMTLIVAKAN